MGSGITKRSRHVTLVLDCQLSFSCLKRYAALYNEAAANVRR